MSFELPSQLDFHKFIKCVIQISQQNNLTGMSKQFTSEFGLYGANAKEIEVISAGLPHIMIQALDKGNYQICQAASSTKII
jgi:hypothetical protein